MHSTHTYSVSEGCMLRLKHGLQCVSRTLKHGLCLTYLKYVTIASFDPRKL